MTILPPCLFRTTETWSVFMQAADHPSLFTCRCVLLRFFKKPLEVTVSGKTFCSHTLSGLREKRKHHIHGAQQAKWTKLLDFCLLCWFFFPTCWQQWEMWALNNNFKKPVRLSLTRLRMNITSLDGMHFFWNKNYFSNFNKDELRYCHFKTYVHWI